jgi:hypothetical protein
MVEITLSDRTTLVNLPTPTLVGRELVKVFSCDTKIPILLNLIMNDEKLRDYISSPIVI